MTQNHCWLAAESNLEKKIESSTQKYRTPSKLQNEIKKTIVILKRKKIFIFEKIDKNVQFNSLFSEIAKIYLRPREAGSFLIYARTEKSCPSEAVSSLRFLL